MIHFPKEGLQSQGMGVLGVYRGYGIRVTKVQSFENTEACQQAGVFSEAAHLAPWLHPIYPEQKAVKEIDHLKKLK